MSRVHFCLDEEIHTINWILNLTNLYKIQQLGKKFPNWHPLHTIAIHKTNTLHQLSPFSVLITATFICPWQMKPWIYKYLSNQNTTAKLCSYPIFFTMTLLGSLYHIQATIHFTTQEILIGTLLNCEVCQTEFFLTKFPHSKIRSNHSTNTYFLFLSFLVSVAFLWILPGASLPRQANIAAKPLRQEEKESLAVLL